MDCSACNLAQTQKLNFVPHFCDFPIKLFWLLIEEVNEDKFTLLPVAHYQVHKKREYIVPVELGLMLNVYFCHSTIFTVS